MEELIACKKAIGKVVSGAPNVRTLSSSSSLSPSLSLSFLVRYAKLFQVKFILAYLNYFLQFLQEILQVLDGTTGLNMLPQAREFNDVIFLHLFIYIQTYRNLN